MLLALLPAWLAGLSVMKLPDKKPAIVHFIEVPPLPKIEEVKAPEPVPVVPVSSKPVPQTARTEISHSVPAISNASPVSPAAQLITSISDTAAWSVTARPIARPMGVFTGETSFGNTPTELKQVAPVGSRELFAAKPRVPAVVEDLQGIEEGFAALVREKIVAAKSYPALARQREFEGRVLISFTLSKNGRVHDLAVKTSSGYETLDDAAIQAVKNAGPFPPIPEKLGRETIAFKLPLSFTLR